MKSWVQLNLILGNLKWMIINAIFVSVLLFLPDQVRELYRVAADEHELRPLAIEYASIIGIGIIIWLGALSLCAETIRLANQQFVSLADRVILYLPSVLGSLPVLAAGLAQFRARPELKTAFPLRVGSVVRIQEMSLVSVAHDLTLFGYLMIVTALIMVAVGSMFNGPMIKIATAINLRYFSQHRSLSLSAALIILITVLFVSFPVALPQGLGTFGLLTVFTFCITGICIHLSLLTIKYQIPIIPIILIYALAISAFDSNDNHFLRTLTADTSQGVNPHKAMNAGEAYVKWLNQRLPTYSGGGQYPVFIVSAEGGGIYAAYNAAVFLSRMQDLCPDFHNHLFAISSVSGGSIGAATFTAALDAIGQTKTLSQYSNDPCPSITQFLSRSQGNDSLEDGGLVEQMVDAALSADFLSPLVAATFFNDFSQQLIPHPVGLLDRARALEYALEDATDKIYRFNSIGKKSNIVRTAFQDYWTPEGPLPALLMNATDSSTGKRIVIAPFKINPQDSPTSEVCDLDAQNSSEHFAISSAAFVSARFPWVSPAATTNIINSCMGQTDENPVPKTRLVDGGYIDNSGVETALNLVTQMKLAATQNHLENSVAVYLISLSGGDFPSNRAFDFGEIAEPIRALLNGREARAYIAINRAQDMLNPRASTGLTSRSLPSFNVTKLQNNFYAMPLGWAISSKTREIIALDSGRFWDCVAGKNFQQADPLKSNADCVQLQIYHLLNNSAATALDDLNTAAAIASELAKSAGATARTELDHEVVLGCYESEWWQRKKSAVAGRVRYLAQYQAEYLDELLRERDRRDNIGNDFLAYILGSISFDSDDFRRTTDNLSFKSVDEIPPSWKAEIAMINRKRANAQPPVPQIDISSLLNNPKRFAEVVWGWEGNVFGNNIGNDGKYDGSIGDGWRYRERGIYQQIGYEQYSDDAKWLSQDDPSFTIDVLHQPDAMSNPTVSARVAFAHFMNWTSNGARGRDQRSAQRRSRDLMNMKLVDVFKKYPGDFAAARLNQTDMGDGGPGDLESVSVRSNMFRSCIDKALQRRK